MSKLFIQFAFFLLLIGYGNLIHAQIKIAKVAETTLKIQGKDRKELYFGFEKGDKVLLTIEFIKGKKLKQIEMFEYPDIPVFSEYKSKSIYDKRIGINHRAIYKFSFTNTSIFSKVIKVKIRRMVKDDKSFDFNTTVYWKETYDTIYAMVKKEVEIKHLRVQTVVPLTTYYLNSGSNATLLGGKSRITFPLNLPENTLECYYQFAAAKNRENLGKLSNLTKQLSGMVDDTENLDVSTDDLKEPFGKTYCDVYLMTFENAPRFERKKSYNYIPAGSRRNAKSGIVKISNIENQNLYIGLKNPLSLYGIHVNFEAAAIVQSIEKKYQTVKDLNNYTVKYSKKPYLKLSKTEDSQK